MTRALVAGWFSFDQVIATVGDERGAEVVAGWCAAAGVAADVAWATYLDRGPTWDQVRPEDYTHLVFVCGPLIDEDLLHALLDRFPAARRLAVGVSVVHDPVADRFDAVWARDGRSGVGADLAVVAAPAAPVVVATVFAPPQPEYGERGRHAQVRTAVEAWLAARGHGWFEVETDMLTGSGTARHASQVAAALGRADVVVTSRLHGLVLGLGQGRPVVAVDPVEGGAKVTAQAEALGWPVVVPGERVGPEALDAAVARCLRVDGPVTVDVGRRANHLLADVRTGLLAELGVPGPGAATPR